MSENSNNTNRDKKIKRAYDLHKSSAKQRGIEFNFTFERWLEWWQIDDRLSRRGTYKDCLVMGRYGDVGPYSFDNCYPTTKSENSRLGNTRAVTTPEGDFISIAEAARQYGLSKEGAQRRVRRNSYGWRYADKRP